MAALVTLTGCGRRRRDETPEQDEDDTGFGAPITEGDTGGRADTGGASTEIFFSYADHPGLSEPDGWALGHNSTGLEVLLHNDPDQGLFANFGLCTHEWCPTEFDAKLLEHVCECHGSRFDLHGDVVIGPAATPLTRPEIRVTKDGVYVELGSWA